MQSSLVCWNLKIYIKKYTCGSGKRGLCKTGLDLTSFLLPPSSPPLNYLWKVETVFWIKKVFLFGQFFFVAKLQLSCFVRYLMHILICIVIVIYLHLVLIFADFNSSTKTFYSYFCLAVFVVLQENFNLPSALN